MGLIPEPVAATAATPSKPLSAAGLQSSTLATAHKTPQATGGRLTFPRFSVGKVTIDKNEQVAVGEIAVPAGKTVELSVAGDITDFAFLENCDPDHLITVLSLKGSPKFCTDDLLHLKNFPNLEAIDLTDSEWFGLQVKRIHGAILKSLKNLRSLKVSGCWLDDDALAVISELGHLEFLTLGGHHQFILSQ